MSKFDPGNTMGDSDLDERMYCNPNPEFDEEDDIPLPECDLCGGVEDNHILKNGARICRNCRASLAEVLQHGF